MPLDARVEAEKLTSMYKEDPRQNSFNLLLVGEKGSGKTQILKTARFPVHIDSFDPGGTATLRKEILDGDIIPDTRWEKENPLEPRVFSLWQYEFDKRLAGGYFDSFGTYCLDSSTLWMDAIGYWVLKTKDSGGNRTTSHVGEPLKWNRDYKHMKNQVELWIRKILTLPCDVIVIGHLVEHVVTEIINKGTDQEDTVEVLTGYDLSAIGQGRWRIPIDFSEVWIMQAKPSSQGVKYQLLTCRQGLYTASTRMGAGGKFEPMEKPDIKYLLKKAGWPCENKPKLN